MNKWRYNTNYYTALRNDKRTPQGVLFEQCGIAHAIAHSQFGVLLRPRKPLRTYPARLRSLP